MAHSHYIPPLQVWSLRGTDTLPPIRFHGFPGFQYPSGMWANGSLLVTYSVNKEDIAITRVALDAITPPAPAPVL